MYKNNFAVAVKVNGKVLREVDQTVKLPFGSEYSVLLKNLNSVRAQAKVSIDGTDVSEWIIIDPNSYVNLERYVRNLEKGNRFKFVERTEDIEEYRGVKIEDGLLRVEYKFESQISQSYSFYQPYNYLNPHSHYITNSTDFGVGCKVNINGILRSSSFNTGGMNCSLSSMYTSSMPTNNNGITVAGSASHQKFIKVPDFSCDPSQVITLSLKGYIGEKKVKKPITVYYRPTCTTCGKTNKPINKFCYNCGTALSII